MEDVCQLIVDLDFVKCRIHNDEKYLYWEQEMGDSKTSGQHLLQDISSKAEYSEFDNSKFRRRAGYAFVNCLLFSLIALLVNSEIYAFLALISAVLLAIVLMFSHKALRRIESIDIFTKEGKLALSFPFVDELEVKKYLRKLSINVRPKQKIK